ncbi:hypothetical protein C7379_11843 [Hallella colorans]|uniref:Uncharacterized protein n=1 Tax=Hallella colorans TaxID=1703337 RepID=A0A2U0U1K3_9BACT|nr:hypothetical protein C7379_11843 [Hallella colorans]
MQLWEINKGAKKIFSEKREGALSPSSMESFGKFVSFSKSYISIIAASAR